MNVSMPDEMMNANDYGTPQYMMTPEAPVFGDTSVYMPEGSAYNAFTPGPATLGYSVGMDSPLDSSGQTAMYNPMASASTPIYAGATPGPVPGAMGYSGGQSGY